MSDINYFGQVNYRNRQDRFGIKLDDRRRHMYVLGKTGMGKTAMLQNMAIQDIRDGRGLGVIDPHGEFADALLDFVPKERVEDVIYFNPADSDHPIGLNLLEDVGFDKRHLVASGLMGVFKKIWVDVWSPRMEYILNNTILALLEYPDATLLDVNRMLANKEFRRRVVEHIKDPVVKAFWTEEFAGYTDRFAAEATPAIQNKVGQFTTAPLIRNIIGQPQSTVDLRRVMDDGKILIVNLSKGRIGEDNSRLLGAMVITKIYLAAMSRVDLPEEKRRDFLLYVDEFQNFASEAFEDILSEARKYRLALILAHQYIAQMDEEVRDAVFGNVGTLITFRVGGADAEHIETEFTPEYLIEDFVNLGKYDIILKLMIDGAASRAFSAKTLAPFKPEGENYRERIFANSRNLYGRPREGIEELIKNWNVKPEEGNAASHSSSAASNYQRQAEHAPAVSYNEQPELYDAICADCGKPTKVPFKPQEGRPIYCKKCMKKHETNRHIQGNSGYRKEEENKVSINERPRQSEPQLETHKKEVDYAGLRELLKDVPRESEQTRTAEENEQPPHINKQTDTDS